MEKTFEKKYHNVENEHWWFKSRRQYLSALLTDISLESKILDIGCSSGIFLKDLENKGFKKENLFGIDISESAIANCKMNGIANAFVMDAQDINLPQKFDIIIASDCLEHLPDDNKALNNWHGLLKDGGKLLVFVPAFQSLWSYHDEINMHYRRYTKCQLVEKIQKSNLKIERAGYWNFVLFLPIFTFRKITNILKKNYSSENDIRIGSSLVNSALLKMISIENKYLQFYNFPFGVSTFCIAKKENL